MQKKGFSVMAIIFIVFFLILALIGAILLFNDNKDKGNFNENNNSFDDSKQFDSGMLNISEDNFNDSVVQRSFLSSSVQAGDELEVMIYVHIHNNETYFFIEEFIPEGWIVKDDAGGKTNFPSKLAWYSFSMLALSGDTSLTYKVQAPSLTGTYDFSGIYQFEGMDSDAPTLGSTAITVA